MKAWEIIKDFIEQNEDQFMEFIEDQYEIEGSDWPAITSQIEDELGIEEGLK